LTFIVLDSKKTDEGVVKAPLKIQVTRGTRISRTHFWHALIDLNEEMDDVEEVNGTSTQPETSR
jgi:hypothetical protein